jgi:hypothetical protein
MILTRDEAFSFLNKLATDSKPVLGCSISGVGFSLFVGSIVELHPDYFIVGQGSNNGLTVLVVPLNDQVSYEYGDTRELTSRIPADISAEVARPHLDRLGSLIEGGLALKFNQQTDVIILIEVKTEGA